jgi:hypothetical protein
MSEPFKIALTAVAGIFVVVLGQILAKLFIEPIQEQWKVRGKIIHALSFYALLDTEKAPQELIRESSQSLRTLASHLQGTTAIPAYKLLSLFRLVLTRKDIFMISIYLVEITRGDARAGNAVSGLIMKRLRMTGLIPTSEFNHREIINSIGTKSHLL